MNIDSSFYQNILSLFEQAAVCKSVESIEKSSVETLRVIKSSQSRVDHVLSVSRQKVYLLVEQDAQLILSVFDKVALTEPVHIDLVIILEQNAQAELHLSIIESLNITYTLHIYMRGDKSTAQIYGLYALGSNQNVSIQTYQYHQGRDTKSNLVIKGLIKDFAKVSYKGLIKIDKKACRTDASQENKTIVLSKKSKVISIPSIEVLQQDVQCCHGSAIGKFNNEHLWYLQSKGLSYQGAYKLLIQSFCKDVLDYNVVNSKKVMELVCKKFI